MSMQVDAKTALEFFGGVADRIMIIAGFFFVIVAVLEFTVAYQLFSISSFVFGIFLVVIGIALHFESPKLKIPSVGGWGTILICLSPILMAIAFAVPLYAVIGRTYIMPTSFRQGAQQLILIDLARPNTWVGPILFWSGIGVLILGILIKFFSDSY